MNTCMRIHRRDPNPHKTFPHTPPSFNHTVLFFPESGLTIPLETTREYSFVAPYAIPCILAKTVIVSQKQLACVGHQVGSQLRLPRLFNIDKARVFILQNLDAQVKYITSVFYCLDSDLSFI